MTYTLTLCAPTSATFHYALFTDLQKLTFAYAISEKRLFYLKLSDWAADRTLAISQSAASLQYSQETILKNAPYNRRKSCLFNKFGKESKHTFKQNVLT